MIKLIKRFAKEEDGATAIEYGLIAALIAVAIIGAVGAVGDQLTTMFQDVADAVEDPDAASAPAPAPAP